MYPKKLAAAAAAATMVVALAACGGDAENADSVSAEQTAANGDVYNAADVQFASDMIPHHAQALTMVDMTRGRDLSPDVVKLTEDIQAAQSPEIQQMVGWLTDWDQPVPETMRDHANAEGHGSSGDHGSSGHDVGGEEGGDDAASDMPGMMSEEEMADLEAAGAQEFETMWLEMMIEHHEGAIEMAHAEQQDGVFHPAIALAESIETTQQAEIAHIEDLLSS